MLSATNNVSGSGMAGLIAGGDNRTRNTAMFDNLIINTVNGPKPEPTVFAQDGYPMYKPRTVAIGSGTEETRGDLDDGAGDEAAR